MQRMSYSSIWLTLGEMLTILLVREVKLEIRLVTILYLIFFLKKKIFSEVFWIVDILQSLKILTVYLL